MEGENKPSGPATPPAPGAPAAPADDKTTPPAPDTTELKFSKADFDKRLEQAKRSGSASTLKDLGFETADAFKTWKAGADKALKAMQDAEKAKMTAEERHATALKEHAEKVATAEKERLQAIEDAKAARAEVEMTRLLVSKGIPDHDYAVFKLGQALDQLDDGEEFDSEKYLDDLLKDPHERIKLGFDASEPGKQPAKTTSRGNGPQPAPKKTNEIDLLTATPEELVAYERSLGLR